jgi:hypothetical protein
MKIATILLIGGLLLALGGIVWWDWSVFATIGLDMPAVGWVALILGSLVTIAVGAGLMFLMFWSNRHGYDDAVGHADGERGREEARTNPESRTFSE